MHLFYKAKKFREIFLIKTYYQKWNQRFSNNIEFNVSKCQMLRV
jgi:hypothetical protein